MNKDAMTWMYHAENEPVCVPEAEAAKLAKDGWADTPAAFAEGEKPAKKGK